MQSLSQLLPVTKTGFALIMFIYQPNQYSCDRVVWHGGESTQLHYEQEAIQNGHPIWKEVYVQTPMEFPNSMSELHEKMIALYNERQVSPVVW